MTYDPTNRKHIRDAEKAAAVRDRARTEFIVAAMSTVQGRVFLHDLIAEASPFVDAPAFDTLRDYFSAGRRSVGLQLMAAILTHCPDQYITMMRESNARDVTAAERTRSPDNGWDTPGPGRDPDDPSPDLFDPNFHLGGGDAQ